MPFVRTGDGDDMIYRPVPKKLGSETTLQLLWTPERYSGQVHECTLIGCHHVP